jgi:sulfite exporter TauE/SafE
MFEYSALIVGFLGSFHCVAMCGPIALALSAGKQENFKYYAGRTFYNAGRITTYAIIGIIAGLAGQALLFAGFQKSLSITIGIIMITAVISLYYLPGTSRLSFIATRLNALIRNVFARVIRKRNYLSLFFGGLANGILPCGFVYLALAGAAATQSALSGAQYMVLFGLGTFPAMMAVSIFGKLAGIKIRGVLVKAAPVLMIMLGIYFIYRGYTMKDNACCHHNNIVLVNDCK